MFGHILEMKKAFLDFKNKKCKKLWRKILNLFHWFIFVKVVLKENVLDDVAERRRSLSGV